MEKWRRRVRREINKEEKGGEGDVTRRKGKKKWEEGNKRGKGKRGNGGE